MEWLPDQTLLTLRLVRGYDYDQIREANWLAYGWRPSRSAVSRRLAKARAANPDPLSPGSCRDLIPWDIEPQHKYDVFKKMLEAESRKRRGIPLSRTDQKAIDLLNSHLYGRGAPFVVTYHPEIGFCLVRRRAEDSDIIRPPRMSA